MERNLRNVLHILSNLKHEGGEEILFDEVEDGKELEKCVTYTIKFET